jgi:hypothetical protein
MLCPYVNDSGREIPIEMRFTAEKLNFCLERDDTRMASMSR